MGQTGRTTAAAAAFGEVAGRLAGYYKTEGLWQDILKPQEYMPVFEQEIIGGRGSLVFSGRICSSGSLRRLTSEWQLSEVMSNLIW